DVQLDIEKTDFSPGVRRMLAAVGSEAPFAQGREQLNLLADLEVTTKTVERVAESIGADIEARQQQDIRSAKQLNLPVIAGPPIPYTELLLNNSTQNSIKPFIHQQFVRVRPLARSSLCTHVSVYYIILYCMFCVILHPCT